MKYRLFSQPGLVAAFFLAFLMPVVLMGQEGEYTVRIKQPAVDPLKTCPGSIVLFMAEGSNADFSSFDPNQVTFTWDFGYNNMILTGQNVSFTYPEGGHYTVRLYVTSRTGGPAAKNIPELEVYIAMRPSFSGTRSDLSSICSGNEIGLTGFVTPIPWTKDTFQFENTYAQYDYTWNGIDILSDRNGIARIKPPLNVGNLNYTFRVKDDFGCSHDTTLTLYGVYASFKVTPKNGEAPLEVKMEVDSSSNGGFENSITYDWEFFENTDTSNLLTTTETKFTLERPGEYTSRVVAKYLQCRNVFTSEEYIRVDSSLLEIPNVFTPNEDGANDYFQVKAVSLKSFSGRIMNRWGRVVYEWTDPKTLEKGWNGRYMNDGQPAPSGTYYYIISATGYDDKVYKGKVNKGTSNEKMYYGFLTLIR
jgi:gliding motility-associated-like protein